MMGEIILSGYYGFHNSGDEALLRQIVSDLKDCKPDVSITVLSADPQQYAGESFSALDRMDWKKLLLAFREAKLLISGGGSLIQDSTSTKSLLYYLMIIWLAKRFGCKVMLYANGVGPVQRRWNRKWVKWVLNRVDLITLREPDSQQELLQMGVVKPTICITADPALGLQPCSEARIREMTEELGCTTTPFVISVRNWKQYDEKLISVLRESICAIRETFHLTPIIVPMQRPHDEEISKKIARDTGAVLFPNTYTIEELLGFLSSCQFVLGMRLHAVIYSFSVGVSPVGIVYDPKVKSCLQYFHTEQQISVEELTTKGLLEAVRKAMELPAPNPEKIKELKGKAKENAKMAVDLLLS